MYSTSGPASSHGSVQQSTRLPDQVRERIRSLHYSLRTEGACLLRIRAFIRFHGLRRPRMLGAPEVGSFLNALVNERNVSASTHKQALCALLRLYREVMDSFATHLPKIAAGTVVSPLDALASPGGPQ